MRLDSVIEEIEALSEEKKTLEDRQKTIAIKVVKLCSALSSAMNHLAKPGTSRVEFQSGSKQYAIEAGVLTRINEVEQIDVTIDVKIED